MNKVTFQLEGHKYFVDGQQVPCVSDILKHFGIVNFDNVDSRVLSAAQNFGSVIHKTFELYDKDDLLECDPKVQPYLDQWKEYKMLLFPAGFGLIEQPLYSKVWNFAGTPDRYENNILLDIKTGVEYISHSIQTAFYQILIEENLKVKVRERYGLYLKPDGYKAIPHRNKSDISIAKSLIQIYNFKKLHNLLEE